MADFEKGFWYDTPYPAPTPQEVKLWEKAFNDHYPLNFVEAGETFCPSVYSNSKGHQYCTRKSGHIGAHRAKDFAAVAEVKHYHNSFVATLATWGEKDQVGLRGQVVATQEEPGNYSDPCTATTKLVGSNQVVYVFRCEEQDGHSGEHRSDVYYSDAVPGYNFGSTNNIMSWTDSGEQNHKQLVGSESKKTSKVIPSKGGIYFAPVGTQFESVKSGTLSNSIFKPDLTELKDFGHSGYMNQTISFTNSLPNPTKPSKCLHSIDNKNFCVESKGHLGFHKGNDFGWYTDDTKVSILTKRSSLIYKASQLKNNAGLPPEVAQTMQEIIDYLKN